MARDAGAGALSGVTYGTIEKTTGALATKAEFDARAAGINRAAKSSKDLNMRLGIEPCNRYETHLLNTAQKSVALIERIGADNILFTLIPIT
ncbi:sugar phosphate isomerase/epimerase [Paracoccaceae bacterium]|nr:sugar phosphate isomerase/epimerase [Paracoccaceae bacterium]